MKKIRYPLIVSDYDRTITKEDGTVSRENREAINEYIACGGKFAVITGRMLSSILPRIRELGLTDGLVAAYQGTLVADIATGRIVRSNSLTNGACLEICGKFGEMGRHCNLYSDEVLYTDCAPDDPYLKEYCRITCIPPVCLGDETMTDFLRRTGKRAEKICCLVPHSERNGLYAELKACFGDRYDICYSASVLVELSPKGDDKGEAMAYIAEYYGIPLEKTVAIGDNNNDIPMISRAGVGIAVGNSDISLREVADVVTVPSDRDAVAKVISEYGFYE